MSALAHALGCTEELPRIQRNWVPDGYLRMIPARRRGALISFLSILTMLSTEDGLVDATQAKLALEYGVSERTIRRMEAELIELEILQAAGLVGARRVLRILPPRSRTIRDYKRRGRVPSPAKTANARPRTSSAGRCLGEFLSGTPTEARTGQPGGGLFHLEQESPGRAAPERSEEVKRRGGGGGPSGGPPSPPPSPGARIYARHLEMFLGKDAEVVERLDTLVGLYGERGIAIWVGECVTYSRGRHRSGLGPGPLIRLKIMSDEVPPRHRNMPDPTEVTRKRREEINNSRPGDPNCQICNSGWGLVMVQPGEDPPPGAVFTITSPTGADYYECACCAGKVR